MTPHLSFFASRLRETIHSLNTTAASFPVSPFNDLALELFSLQWTHNPVYRGFCHARNISPAGIHHWKDIPALPVAAFKEFDVTSLAPEERVVEFHSSGTTEQRRSRHIHSVESLSIYEVSLWPWFAAHILAQEKNRAALNGGSHDSPVASPKALLCLTPPPEQAPHSSLVQMFDVVRRQLGGAIACFVGDAGSDGSWALNLDAALSFFQDRASSGCPVILLGTAFSFIHLLDGIEERGAQIQLPPGARVMETGGYKGRSRELPRAELHSLITKRLGVPASRIVCEYGMSELSSQAYDCKVGETQINRSSGKRTFHFPPWARAQMVSPEDGQEVAEGETGLLRIFDLANVYSVMAIQTEDLAVKRGDGFELIGRARAAEQRGCSLMSAAS